MLQAVLSEGLRLLSIRCVCVRVVIRKAELKRGLRVLDRLCGVDAHVIALVPAFHSPGATRAYLKDGAAKSRIFILVLRIEWQIVQLVERQLESSVVGTRKNLTCDRGAQIVVVDAVDLVCLEASVHAERSRRQVIIDKLSVVHQVDKTLVFEGQSSVLQLKI